MSLIFVPSQRGSKDLKKENKIKIGLAQKNKNYLKKSLCEMHRRVSLLKIDKHFFCC